MVRRLHADGHEIDVRMCGESNGISKGQPRTIMFCCRIGGSLTGRANPHDFEVQQRFQSGNMGNRGEPAPGVRTDDADADLAALGAARRG